eukprot:756809-Hanusia_phi.AAC.7
MGTRSGRVEDGITTTLLVLFSRTRRMLRLASSARSPQVPTRGGADRTATGGTNEEEGRKAAEEEVEEGRESCPPARMLSLWKTKASPGLNVDLMPRCTTKVLLSLHEQKDPRPSEGRGAATRVEQSKSPLIGLSYMTGHLSTAMPHPVVPADVLNPPLSVSLSQVRRMAERELEK